MRAGGARRVRVGGSIERVVARARPVAIVRGTAAAFAATVAVGAAMAGAQPDGRPSGMLVEAGRTEYARYCASCHGAEARGDGPVAESLRTPPPDLTGIAERRGGKFPSGDIAAFIDGRLAVTAHGTREMPVWGHILGVRIAEGTTEDEVARGRIDALVAYLQSIQR